jgi:hypothetical protein
MSQAGEFVTEEAEARGQFEKTGPSCVRHGHCLFGVYSEVCAPGGVWRPCTLGDNQELEEQDDQAEPGKR